MSQRNATYIDLFLTIYMEQESLESIVSLENECENKINFLRPAFASDKAEQAIRKGIKEENTPDFLKLKIMGGKFDDNEVLEFYGIKTKKKVSKYGIFASKVAMEYAEEHGITEDKLDGLSPSSANGFTKKDLLSLTEEKKSKESNGSKYGIFASKAAMEYAMEKNLSDEDFEELIPSGKLGFTKGDIQKNFDAPKEKKSSIFSSKAAEKFANENGITEKDLKSITPSGKDGKFKKSDIEQLVTKDEVSVMSNDSKNGIYASKKAMEYAMENKVVEEDLKASRKPSRTRGYSLADVKDFLEDNKSVVCTVKFASAAAKKKFLEYNLTDEDFKGFTGKLKTEDVEKKYVEKYSSVETEDEDEDYEPSISKNELLKRVQQFAEEELEEED